MSMEGSSFEGECEFSSTQTLLLVGRKGTGKSATGNTILGTNLFRSERSSSSVTSTCELRSSKLKDGRMVNVIDTPGIDINYGILGSSVDTEFGEEVINMAGVGIHAILVVLSVRSRFSKEEDVVISRLLSVFGSKVYDYMILVFTGGDQLDKDDETLESFLHDCPGKLKELLNLCDTRCVLFDNKTKDELKRSDQVEKLFSIVNMVSRKNGGKPYTNDVFTEWKKEAKEQAKNFQALKELKPYTEMEVSMRTDPLHDVQFKQIFEMVEPKLKERTLSLERRLAEERAAWLKAEEDATVAQEKSDIMSMEGSLFEDDCEFSSTQTLLLVGRKGTGKSATGNTILGTNLFKSERSSSSVTSTCELRSSKLKDGRMVNVIDTPGIDINYGILGSSVDTEFSEEVINMAGVGIHAILVVLSVRSRFSKEEDVVISRLLSVFGSKVYDYMILVFTGGDQLDKDDETLESFLHDCPEKLKELLNLCDTRRVLFDNKTKDELKRSDQVEKLFSIVNMVSRKNGGKLYTNEIVTEWKKEAKELKEEAENSQALNEFKPYNELEVSMQTDPMHDGAFKRIIEMVEPKLKERTLRLERQLAEERAARLKAEEDATVAQKKSDEEIRYINKQIETAMMRRRRALRNPTAIENGVCVIL